MPPETSRRSLASNRRALRDYLVIERLEAGIELKGTEVKSVRNRQLSLAGGFVRWDHGQAFLCNLNITPYEYGNRFNHEADRQRRLLLHRGEIQKLRVQVEQKGLTVIPLSVYLRKGLIKVELGLCRGKRQSDKRETLKRRTADREAARAMADRNRKQMY